MGRTNTPLHLVWIHFCVGNCPVIGLGHSAPYSTEVKNIYRCISNPPLGYNGLF